MNTLLLFKLCIILSTVEIGCLSLIISWFALHMSVQRPCDLGTTTNGLTNGVGPWAGFMMSRSTSSWIFTSTFHLRLKGVLLIGWAARFTFGSMWSLTAWPFSFPKSLCFSCRISPYSLSLHELPPLLFLSSVPRDSLQFPILVLRGSPSMLITQKKLALTEFSPAVTSQKNVPIISSGVWDAFSIWASWFALHFNYSSLWSLPRLFLDDVGACSKIHNHVQLVISNSDFLFLTGNAFYWGIFIILDHRPYLQHPSWDPCVVWVLLVLHHPSALSCLTLGTVPPFHIYGKSILLLASSSLCQNAPGLPHW